MNGYKCFWKHGIEVEVYADDTYDAQTKAFELVKVKAGRKKVKRYEISVHLCEKNGEPVAHQADF